MSHKVRVILNDSELNYLKSSFESSRPDASCLTKPSISPNCMDVNPLCIRFELDFEIPYYDDHLMHLGYIAYSPESAHCLRNYILSQNFNSYNFIFINYIDIKDSMLIGLY